MSLNQILNPIKKLDIKSNSINSNEIILNLNDGLLNLHSLGTKGLEGTSIISNGDGTISWSNSISAKQRDVFLIEEDTIFNFNSETDTELIFPHYRDGAFTFENEPHNIIVDIRIYYKYVNTNQHLPFYLSVKKNDDVVYTENFGDYDDYTKNQKLNESIVINASNSDIIKIFIKKKFNDSGDFMLLKNSFITYEIL